MATSALSRRGVLAGLALCTTPTALAQTDGVPAFVSAARRSDGSFAAVVLSEDGSILHTEPLSARGHDAAVRADPHTAVVFARRPGQYAVVLDLSGPIRTAVFAPPPTRRFAGHGFFSRDGRVLYATENDFENERGVIGLYDATDNYRRIGEFDTHGVGPHEALLLSDGRTIAVANGGIATHPDFPRLKLNLATMAPSLVLLSAEDGALLAKVSLPASLHQLSIRHMAETRQGRIWFGAQFEGSKQETPPLVGIFTPLTGIEMVDASAGYTQPMSHYVGSVAVSKSGEEIMTTSPRGNLALVWDVARRTITRTLSIPDVCGAAPTQNGFAVTAGTGAFRAPETRAENAVQFDNHLAAAWV